MKKRKLSHDDLVERAVKWLKTKRYPIVCTEIASGRETADAVGFNGRWSCLIECKTSLSDFYSDRKKFFRREPQYGIGQSRYYMCEKNLIDLERHSIPEGWGLLYVCGKVVRKVRDSAVFNNHADGWSSLSAERTLLLSLLRRQVGYGFVRFKAHSIETVD